MTLAIPHDYVRELVPGTEFVDGDPQTAYWTRSGREVLYRHDPIRGADRGSFRFFLGGFAKDARACYCTHTRIRGADPESFRALNFTYFADATSAWTMGGIVKGADIATFSVCDAGAESSLDLLIPTGYARDSAQVYYYNFDGKPN